MLFTCCDSSQLALYSMLSVGLVACRLQVFISCSFALPQRLFSIGIRGTLRNSTDCFFPGLLAVFVLLPSEMLPEVFSRSTDIANSAD